MGDVSRIQTNLFVDQCIGKDISKITKVQEIAQEIYETKKIATAIATAQEECCEELKKLLEQLNTLVREQGNSTRLRISDRVKNLLDSMQENFVKIETALQNISSDLEPLIDTLGDRIEKKLVDELKKLQKKLLEELKILRDQLQKAKEEILSSLTVKFGAVETILGGVETFLAVITATFGAITTLGVDLDAFIVGEHAATRVKIISEANGIRQNIFKLKTDVKKN